MMARLKELEAENRRLKKMYAEERLKAEIVPGGHWQKGGEAISTQRDGSEGGISTQGQYSFGRPGSSIPIRN